MVNKGSNREINVSDATTTVASGAKLSKRQLIKLQEKKAKQKKYITMAASIMIVVAMIIGVVSCTIGQTPNLKAEVVATYGDGKEVDGAMFAYFLYGQYQSYVNEYYYYLSYLGLTPGMSLKSQTMYGGETSWFVYFAKLAKQQVNELVALASAAEKNGVTLDEKDEKTITDYIDSVKSYAKENKYASVNKYLASVYCSGVTIDAVERCLRLEQIANKYYKQLLEKYEEGITDEDVEKYITDNKGQFYKTDYIYYTFAPEYEKDATSAEKEAAVKAAKEKADELFAKVKDADNFKELIYELEKAAEDAKNNSSTSKTADTTEDTTADTTEDTTADTSTETGDSSGKKDPEKSKESYYEKFIKEGIYFATDDDYAKWAYADDRKAGDFTLIESKDEDDNVTGYTVYLITKTSYRDEYKTVNVRHILFTTDTYGSADAAKAKAQEILDKYKAGTLGEEEFAKLAEEYSEDGGSNTNGGLYENVVKDQMVEEFNDWIFDEKRAEGDVEIVTSQHGYHVMFFDSFGEEVWKANAKTGIKGELYEKEIKELKTQYPVTYNDQKILLIP